MSAYNVVRNKRDDYDPMPEVLDAVFDGEMDASDPRVVELLRTNPEAARRFREMSRVVDRLQCRPIVPDLSESILAVVHAKQPYAPKRRRSRVTPQRVAFAGGLLAGIALVVLLQSVAKPRQGVAPIEVARTHVDNEITFAAPSEGVLDVEASVTTSRGRAPLAFHDSARYEAHFDSSVAPMALAGTSGDVDLTERPGARATVFAATAYQGGPNYPVSGTLASSALSECVDDVHVGPSLLGASVTGDTPLIPLIAASYSPSKEWPPADIGAFIEHIEMCGVTDEFKIATRAN